MGVMAFELGLKKKKDEFCYILKESTERLCGEQGATLIQNSKLEQVFRRDCCKYSGFNGQ